jgi:transcriptional regulator with XRE-family HTH domain
MRRFTLRERIKLGDTIRRIRLRGDWSQVELAQSLNVSQSVVSEWEAGSRIPSEEALVRLATIAKRGEADILVKANEKARRRRARRDATSEVAVLPHAITLPQNGAEVNVRA